MEQGGRDGGGGGEVVEEASPISSRPPANFEELMRFSATAYDGGGGGGGGGGSSSSGNRWPREETLALLRIRSDMDSVFRDATLKAPLWEDVSRKLSELGYKRSAKKCKEKFENVQKYYKRTKEARGGRQDGKAYKFFSQLEALNTSTADAASTLDVAPLSIANPIQTPFSTAAAEMPSSSPFTIFPPPPQPRPQMAFFTTTPITPTPPPAAAVTAARVTFSSHSSSTASGMGSDENNDDDMDVDATNVTGPSSRKRKHGHRQGESGNNRMMEAFEGLVKQVLQKQTAMQRGFLEALEKREKERIDREEAWKRQEMSRLAREHEFMTQERAASASREAVIVSLIQKITGHAIHFPTSITQPQPPPPQPPQNWPLQPAAKPTAPLQQIQDAHHHQHSKAAETSNVQTQVQPIMAIPQQQIPPPLQDPKKHDSMGGGSGSSEPASSRWPKAEVLALINVRSGFELRFQGSGLKGPLWEEISDAMRRMGYNRNAKRCKEKWENINKYYKKVKESNKKRPEDAKTCPYFNRLDALYRNKVLGGSSSSGAQPHRTDQDPTLVTKENREVGLFSVSKLPQVPNATTSSSENRNEQHMEESTIEGAFREGRAEKPEDLVKEVTQQEQQPQLVIGENEPQSYNFEGDEDEDEEEDEAYELGCQSNTNRRRSNGHAERSFLTMVQ